MWSKVCSKSHDHKIFIWNRQDSHLDKILEGPKEGVQDITVFYSPSLFLLFSRSLERSDINKTNQWHPHLPIIVSASNSGMLYVWTAGYTENWSAFAPDFEELEENFEYIEREDEFDIV